MASPAPRLVTPAAPAAPADTITAPPAPAAAVRETNFSPSPGQLRLLEALQNLEDVSSVQELCTQNGVSRASFYRWQRDPQFRLWLSTRMGEALHVSAITLVVGALNATLNGDNRMQMAMLKFAINPNGLAGFIAFTTQGSDALAVAQQRLGGPPAASDETPPEPELVPESAAAPAAAPDQPPASVLSATFRLLNQVREPKESHLHQARRAALFARYMDEIAVRLPHQTAWRAAVDATDCAAPPAPGAQCSVPTNPEP